MDRPYGISDFAFPSRWERESGPDLVERAGQGSRADREQSQTGRGKGSNSTRSRGGFDRPVTIYRGRDREYSLRESEVRTLTDLGKFRVVPEDDLARFGYQGNYTQMASDIRRLTRQGLVEQRTIEGHSSYSTKVLTLTKDGHRLLERAQLVSSRQATYHGLVKLKEADTTPISTVSTRKSPEKSSARAARFVESSSTSSLRRTSTKPFPGCGPTKTLDTKESS